MSIVGSTPESGVRIDVEPAARRRAALAVRGRGGHRRAPGSRWSPTVSAEGDVLVELPPEAPEGIAERVRLLMRAAYKHAREDAQPPPRRIVRWRAEVDLASPRRGG